jgi:O-methyltransferase involved in polyketide biosynthesis
LGAGLDTRFFRVDDGRVRWYELDLPQSIALRRRFLQDSPRHTMLAASALDFGWMDDIEARPHTLIIAEGLLMYFDEADVRRLLLALAERFRGGDAFI